MASWAPPGDTNARSHAQADPKPAGRQKANREGWEAIRERFQGQVCVCCGLGDQVELHHILPRSQGGDDLAVNLVVLCRSCHTRLEGHESGWENVAGSVRQYVITDNARRNYQEDHAGESFHRRYPPLPNTDPRFAEDFERIYGFIPTPGTHVEPSREDIPPVSWEPGEAA